MKQLSTTTLLTWSQGEVESAVVLKLADDPGAVADDLDGGGPVGEPLILQAWPRVGEDDALAAEPHLWAEGDRALADLPPAEDLLLEGLLVVAE